MSVYHCHCTAFDPQRVLDRRCPSPVVYHAAILWVHYHLGCPNLHRLDQHPCRSPGLYVPARIRGCWGLAQVVYLPLGSPGGHAIGAVALHSLTNSGSNHSMCLPKVPNERSQRALSREIKPILPIFIFYPPNVDLPLRWCRILSIKFMPIDT